MEHETAGRIDHRLIAEMIPEGSSVLDLGCGDGELLALLAERKHVRGQGIEIDERMIYACVGKGLHVFHGDIDSGLSEYPDGAFDFVVLNQSLQQVRHVDPVLSDALRVGRKVVVGFPNFAYYRARFQLSVLGKVPVTGALPYRWHETPNLHFLSVRDFADYCWTGSIAVERRVYIDGNRTIRAFPNLRAQTALFLLHR